jgi:hypothetical protein
MLFEKYYVNTLWNTSLSITYHVDIIFHGFTTSGGLMLAQGGQLTPPRFENLILWISI